ncbi:polyamine-transporting ATPase 13A3-like isoform X2 [Periplaneta americana]|uniref:polyamine-transporting ATPase 13A3-like isoform X2 n=1 Tax=Periplaneta americana TaxID=6978 RepID=UPI0037E7225D
MCLQSPSSRLPVATLSVPEEQRPVQHAYMRSGSRDNHGPPPLQSGIDYINPGEEDQMEVYGYQRHPLLTTMTWLLIGLTAGILRLVFHWWPHWMLYATHRKCPLRTADKVLIVELYQSKHKCFYVKPVQIVSCDDNIQKGEDSDRKQPPVTWDDHMLTDIKENAIVKLSVHLNGGVFKELPVLRLFRCKKLSYVWDDDRGEFLKLRGLDRDITTAGLHQQEGLSAHQQSVRRIVYGRNEIIVPIHTIITLLFLEVLNPFYVFQLFSFCLWFADDYMYYALAILAMSAFGIVMAIIQTRKNQRNLRSTVHSSDVATVIRSDTGKLDTIPTEHLVPGDVLVVPSHGCIMHCDAVLLTGNCIINESMLTGESVPVTKTPLPNSADIPFDAKEHARHILFCGTHVIQTRYFGNERVLAVVIRTGFSTAKGDLVRSIMYPPPVDFKFEHDSYKFVELLACIASIGFIYTVITKYMRGISVSEIALESLDLITIVVPPALPAAMTVGRFYAQNRLQAKNVYCISPRTINVSGSIDCVCFDKTGTLTEDGLDMWGVIPVADKKFQVPVKSVDKMDNKEEFLVGMVTCHSLTIIDGKLSGDPLDLKMFESTGWQLEEPEVNDNSKFDMIFPTVVRPPNSTASILQNQDQNDLEPPLEIGIVRQFPFSSNLQRMSIITRTLGAAQFQVYCKGSPEMILSLSRPDTVPSDLSSVLEEYTQEGYRVLALAYKGLPRVSYVKVQRLAREDVEAGLIFLGLIIMENRLKPETTGIVSMLRNASIRTIMVTGDNMLTALSVARDCGIIPLGQRVVVAHGLSGHSGQPAQLLYTNANNNIPPPPVMNCTGDLQNSGSVISFETMESGTLSPTTSTITEDDSAATTNNSYCFAMTGKTWTIAKTHFPEVIPKLVTRGTVFARMSPDQKQQLVQELQALGYYVAMCGDGANDCGALKAAHAGISLSEAESSVASPFTSKEANISCVPRVIREGRAALVTSFGIFKYMAAYSLTQFVTVMILYSIDSNLTDIEFLYIDLFVITVFAFFFGRTEAFDGPLVKQPPILSLISLSPILSLLMQLAVVIVVQWISFYWVQQMSWFVPFNSSASGEEDRSNACFENYALFTVSSMQYIILALVFSKGAPYRKSIFSNYGFLASLIFLTGFTLYLTLDPADWLKDIFELMVPLEMDFRLMVVVLAFVNFVLAAFIEYFVIDYLIFSKLRYRFHNIEKSHRKFLSVECSLQHNPLWPPIKKEVVMDVPPDMLRKPPCSPAAASVSTVQIEFSHREVTLNPSILLPPKRRHHSETDYGDRPSEFLTTVPRNATLPRRGPNSGTLEANNMSVPNVNLNVPDEQ